MHACMQVGRIYEMIGDGAEAVAHLQLGKKISSSVNSPLFIVAFSSLLGIFVAFPRLISFHYLIYRKLICHLCDL